MIKMIMMIKQGAKSSWRKDCNDRKG